MTTLNPGPRVVKQAIHWMLKLRESGHNARLQQQCEQWRATHQEHELAWQRVQSLHQELNLRAVPGASVALQTLENSSQRLQRRQALKLLSGVLVFGSAAWLGKDLQVISPLTADFASGTGQRRSVRLPDGSLLQLNTNSAVDLAFEADQRLIRLKHGELLLTCAKDTSAPGRPLLVSTRDALLQGFNGHFVVRQDDNCTRVSVSQGTVVIHSPGPTQWIHAGQSYRLDTRGATLLQNQDMDAGAWAEGLIVTRDMRLGDFLAEVGRYRHGYVSCADDIADLRLSGVFRLEDTDKLLQLLPQTLPVTVSYRTRWWVRLERLA
ncbi:FecR family protein [Pseudomonas wadenswilerensis]|jgi:ferric-dicitrate binding protein FerR (iron transport regulator)|uniref:Protein FecR n=1 Tax=Pseudomonas wadenswilerensis TaxID=1785161 RepID=A0A380T8U4_9PSED|nr:MULTISPECIES: FecR family protein [Pseudomonas]UVM22093.1 FecR family protein [Pseudomonas wadenswilerensis]SPO64326.1 Peptide ABC transporter substrate-binding protein [Pseudomonas sp. JV241A]SUQ65916.1 Protein FecR [Pseudomonas wadenswilerensis]